MRKLSKETINESLKSRQSRMIGDYLGSNIKTKFSCKYDHTWDGYPSNILQGRGCFVCSGKMKLSKFQINERLHDRNIEMIGEYEGALIKTKFKCACEFEWYATPGNILSGRGCPGCTSHGFNKNKIGFSYILGYNNFLKFGITNDIKRRLKEHSRKNGQFVIIKIKEMAGTEAIKWENFIKTHYKGHYVSKNICPDGWTETLSLSLVEEIVLTLS